MAKAAQDAGLSVNGTVKEMMKLQQEGKLVSSKVLPHFAKRMHDAATANNALNNALKSNRVAMNQMITGMQMAADTIFKSGWSEGLTSLFKSIGDLFKENEHTFIAFGKVMGSVFKGLAWLIDNVVNPVMSAFGSILTAVVDGLEAAGSWAALLLLPLGKMSPMVKMITWAMRGLGLAMAPVIATTLAWAAAGLAVLATLEEIAEFFSPTGKKTLIGVNIHDVLGKNEESITKNKDFWAGTFKNMYTGDQWAKDRYGVGAPKTSSQPIVVHTELSVSGEKLGTTVSKTNAIQSTIDQKLAESTSFNFN